MPRFAAGPTRTAGRDRDFVVFLVGSFRDAAIALLNVRTI
jgi:hypothetical protein